MSAPVLEVRHLRLVRALVEEGGPTRAAARLHLTQSAVSHQLAELEARLGVRLFARVRRRLAVTPAGQRVLEAARVTLGELARVEQELQRAHTQRPLALRFVVETFTAYHWLPRVAAAFARELPHVELRIHAEARRDPVAALLRGTLDVALQCAPLREPGLVATALFADEWTVLLPRAHPLAKRRCVGMTELQGHTVFANDASRSDVERLRELLAREQAPMPKVSPVPYTDALVGLVEAGLGVGLVSRWAVTPWLRARGLACRPLTKEGVREQWSAVHRREAPREVLRFVELVRAANASRKR